MAERSMGARLPNLNFREYDENVGGQSYRTMAERSIGARFPNLTMLDLSMGDLPKLKPYIYSSRKRTTNRTIADRSKGALFPNRIIEDRSMGALLPNLTMLLLSIGERPNRTMAERSIGARFLETFTCSFLLSFHYIHGTLLLLLIAGCNKPALIMKNIEDWTLGPVLIFSSIFMSHCLHASPCTRNLLKNGFQV